MPRLLEIETFRYCEHVGPGDDFSSGYRSTGPFENWKSKDPLINDKESIKKFLPEINEKIQEAVNFAEESPWPEAQELLSDII
jgi:pyruvate dehydrogenase E1 component alpha subunit